MRVYILSEVIPVSPLHLQQLKSQYYNIITLFSHNMLYYCLIPRRCWTLPIVLTVLGVPFEYILPSSIW